MGQTFFAGIADIKWKIEHEYPDVRESMADYILAGEPETAEEIVFTQEDVQSVMEQFPQFEAGYAESDCIYQKIAEMLPMRSCLLMHGAVITYGESAYMFTAPSGTGKSTHISLWRKYLGKKVEIVNGDKPIVRVDESGVTVYGTPWGGKEKWQKNRSAPLAAICLIHRSKENKITRISPGEYLNELIQQAYLPQKEEEAAKTLELLDQLMVEVPFYLLECDMSEGAVQCSFEKLTGFLYTERRKVEK